MCRVLSLMIIVSWNVRGVGNPLKRILSFNYGAGKISISPFLHRMTVREGLFVAGMVLVFGKILECVF